MMREVQRLISDAKRRAMRVVRRGIVRVATASGFVQITGGDGEIFDGAELWQQYGFSSRPAAGSEALILLVDGNRDQAIAVAGTSRGDRPSALAAGDAMLWATKSGSDQAAVHVKADGNVDINCAAGEFAHLGGSTDAELALLGETVKTNVQAFADVVKAITPGDAAANAIALGAIKTAAAALSTAAGSWLATKAKVA